MNNPVITIIAPMHYENNSLVMFIGSMLCQTFKDFKVFIVHNGFNEKAREIVESFEDSRFSFFDGEDTGFWGCKNRAKFLQLVESKYVIQTSIHDYYTPNALDEMMKYNGSDFIYFNSINHIFGYDKVLISYPQLQRIDWGNFCVLTRIAQEVNIEDTESFTADGFFVERLMKSGLVRDIKKSNHVLTIHN